MNIDGMMLFLFSLSLHYSAGPQKPQPLTATSMETLDQKTRFLIKIKYFGALLFQECEFFDH